MPDAPPLDLKLASQEGVVGSIVQGRVDVSDEDAMQHCITDPEEFVLQFVPDIEYPGAPADHPPLKAAFDEWYHDPNTDSSGFETPSQFAGAIMTFFPLGLALDLPFHDGDGSAVESSMASTFILAFADLATMQPIDPLGSFDWKSGEGQVEVPDVNPGMHPVIATCVGLPDEISSEDFYAAMDKMIEFIDENVEAPYPVNPLGDEFAEVAGQVAPILIRELVEPKALGIQMFCVDDGTGSCEEEDTPDPTDPKTPPGEGGEGNGEGGSGPGGSGGSQAPGATPVTGRPSYTG